jgi:anti-sigma regulatory factor (Ser/Thr protein kinase)
VTTVLSREQRVAGRLFLTGYDDRHSTRPRRASGGSVRESLTLPDDFSSAGAARDITRRMCVTAGMSEDATDSAVLLTSEVVTNALLHSRGDARLTVTTSRGGVRVEVGDGTTDRPCPGPEDAEATHGRGLQLVEMCASSWGSRPTARGKCVWFQVAP